MQASAHKVDIGLFLYCGGDTFQEQGNDILKIEVNNFCPCFMMHEFEPTEFHAVCVCFKVKSLLLRQNFFCTKTGLSMRKLSLQHVFSLCPCNMPQGMCQPYVTKHQPSDLCSNLQVFCFLVEGSTHWETDPLHIVAPGKTMQW